MFVWCLLVLVFDIRLVFASISIGIDISVGVGVSVGVCLVFVFVWCLRSFDVRHLFRVQRSPGILS